MSKLVPKFVDRSKTLYDILGVEPSVIRCIRSNGSELRFETGDSRRNKRRIHSLLERPSITRARVTSK